MTATKPNVLIITTHDSCRHFGCYGIPTVHTPAIDAFAAAHTWPSWNQILKRFEGAPDAAQQHIAEFQGSLREVDRGVGIVLQALEARSLAENTIVVFNTDHGPELPGAKWTLYDAGIGIAFILRWPGGGVCGGHRDDALHGNVDFLPTLYDWLSLQTMVPFDGVSFAGECGAITGGKPAPARSCIYSSWVDGLNFCVRTSRFKLIRNLVPLDASGRESPKYELYDLESAPCLRRTGLSASTRTLIFPRPGRSWTMKWKTEKFCETTKRAIAWWGPMAEFG